MALEHPTLDHDTTIEKKNISTTQSDISFYWEILYRFTKKTTSLLKLIIKKASINKQPCSNLKEIGAFENSKIIIKNISKSKANNNILFSHPIHELLSTLALNSN